MLCLVQAHQLVAQHVIALVLHRELHDVRAREVVVEELSGDLIVALGDLGDVVDDLWRVGGAA